MGRTRIDRALANVAFTVKLAPDDRRFLDEQKRTLRRQAVADVVRDFAHGLRTLCDLPDYQVARLRRDMADRQLTVLAYFKELLARRYESLAREDLGARSEVQQ